MFTNAAENLTCEHLPLSTTREERGRQIAQMGGIKQIGQKYKVPSQSGGSGCYIVDLVDETCTCADYEVRRQQCKHYHAALFFIVWEGSMNTTASQAPVKRKTYRQNWPAYERAQQMEKEQVELLLKSLCATIEEPPAKATGRPSIPLRDKVFAATMKVYVGMSGRRASSDIRWCAERGHIDDAPHYSSIFRCLESEATTEILTRLIEESAAPLASIENVAGQFSQDSTGFGTKTYCRWFSEKWGKVKTKQRWTKLHIMIGTVTNVVTSVKVSDVGDSKLLIELLNRSAKRFIMREVSADKAYLSKKNLAAIDAVGAVPFIPFKNNSVGTSSKSPHWRRMWAYFSLKYDEFMASYHRRSNVETTMWMLKSKFGGALRSKLATPQVNEVLCKVLLHNLCCIIHAIAEYGIEVDFAKPTPPSVPSLVN